MSWHNFQPSQPYPLDEIVRIGEARQAADKVIDWGKKDELIRHIERAGSSPLIWTPFAQKGWGRSPFNPSCWRTVDGAPITTDPVPDLHPDPDD